MLLKDVGSSSGDGCASIGSLARDLGDLVRELRKANTRRQTTSGPWFSQGLATPEAKQPATVYVQLLRELVGAGKLRAFVCHFYNFYFAHTAGGRMIGKVCTSCCDAPWN